MSPESETAATSPPPFGESYAKARKAYGLSSALLLAWELVGIEIEQTPVETLKISLKSPQAAPYVLIALVAYFALHFTIEWYQAAPARRVLPASRLDFMVGHVIGGSAIALYAIQSFLRVQIADKIPSGAVFGFTLGAFSAFLGLAVWDIAKTISPPLLLGRGARRIGLRFLIPLAPLAVLLAVITPVHTMRPRTLVYIGAGYIVGLGLVGFQKRLQSLLYAQVSRPERRPQ